MRPNAYSMEINLMNYVWHVHRRNYLTCSDRVTGRNVFHVGLLKSLPVLHR